MNTCSIICSYIRGSVNIKDGEGNKVFMSPVVFEPCPKGKKK